MADSVRRVLEEMVPELEDMEEKGYFSRTEIRQIIQTRQDYEYNLQRRASLKGDFVRSIDYEKTLEKLRVLRKKQRHIRGSPSISDYCIVRRTHKLYERSLRKFKGDLSLWNDWIQFCAATRSSRQMSMVLTRVMQLFPNSAAAWTYAAAWELEHNNNATSARSLMQTGIRMCKNDPSLWVEYFRMELLYAARLTARRRILGVEEAIDDATKTLLSGGVARVVYTNAVKSLPTNSRMRIKFLKVLGSLPIMNKGDLEEFIIQDILTGFPKGENNIWHDISQYLFLRARSGGSSVDEGIRTALQIFDREPSITMLEDKLKFLEECFDEASQCENVAAIEIVLTECLHAAEQVLKNDLMTDGIILRLSRAYQRVGDYKNALTILNASPSTSAIEIEKACLQSFDDAVKGDIGLFNNLVDAFLQLNGDSRSESLWLTITSLVNGSKSALLSLAKQFEKDQLASLTHPADSRRGLIAASITNNIHLNVSLEDARKFYKQILKGPLPGATFVIEVGKMEMSLMSSHDPNALSADEIRHIYKSGVDVYGSSSVALWLEYYLFEINLGKQGHAGMVHWKAKESLVDADAFVIKSNFTSRSCKLESW